MKPWKNWLTFCRQHFQLCVLKGKCLYLDSNSTDLFSSQYWFRLWFGTKQATRHDYLNQWWLIVKWRLFYHINNFVSLFQDTEITKFSSKVKELEEERHRLARTGAQHQTQMEKFRKMADDGRAKSEALETQLNSMKKVFVIIQCSSSSIFLPVPSYEMNFLVY